MPAMKPIPNPSDYHIDKSRGFLPNPNPLKRLSSYYEPWEVLMDHLSALIVSGTLRKRILDLETLDLLHLNSLTEYQRAYSILSFLAHGYIYGVPKTESVIDILPQSIAKPWFKVSEILRVKPVCSYASVGLWNWYLLDPNGPFDLSNMAILHTFSGSYDEAWFYLVPLAIEYAGASIVENVLQAQLSIKIQDKEAVKRAISTIADSIDAMVKILPKMYEKCDPQVFWNRVRPYNAGSKNNALMANGLFFEGVTTIDEHVNTECVPPQGLEGTWRKYAGASAGQSPLIHTIDAALQIEHFPMASKEGAANINPMLEMRLQLPQEYQDFIKLIEEGPSIRDFCANPSNECLEDYNKCITFMKQFRDLHLQMATKYIINQRGQSSGVGTGGTDLVPFLKQVRDETIGNKI